MSSISNYGELKDTVKGYLFNRKDMDFHIPKLVELSERRIYRSLRCPANEKMGYFQIQTSISERTHIEIPRDFLECKYFTMLYADKLVLLERVSDLEMIRLRGLPYFVAEPEKFARLGRTLTWYPKQDIDLLEVQMVYWADYSGQLVEDTDTNEILRIAPDLYVYGALVESEPFLGHDERIPVWNDMFNQALAQINNHAITAEMSGSALDVGTTYS